MAQEPGSGKVIAGTGDGIIKSLLPGEAGAGPRAQGASQGVAGESRGQIMSVLGDV